MTYPMSSMQAVATRMCFRAMGYDNLCRIISDLEKVQDDDKHILSFCIKIAREELEAKNV